MLKKFLKIQNFDKNFNFFLPILLIILVITSIATFNAIISSPIDYQQGNAVKIMYIHVPCAWMAILIYTLMASFNLAGFIWKNRFFYVAARAMAEIGGVYCLITLLTGSIWGKPIWGTWWAWDARLTSMLILFFLYCGYLLVFDNTENRIKAEKISAIIAIVGFVNIPIIKFSVEYWNSLHQKASILRKGGIAIDNAFLKPLFLAFICYFCIFVIATFMRIKIAIMKQKIASIKLKNHNL